MRRPMLNDSEVGAAVYGPFLGSGSTVIAAETCGRVCFGIELDPLFVDVSVRRWPPFTGRYATFKSTEMTFDTAAVETRGKSFEEVAAERHAGERSPFSEPEAVLESAEAKRGEEPAPVADGRGEV